MNRSKIFAGVLFVVALLAIAVAAVGASGSLIIAPRLAAEYRPGPCPAVPGQHPVPKDASCGQLIVPEDRAHPNGKTISLSVATIPAAKPAEKKSDPVVWLAGGPGDDALTEIGMAKLGDLDSNREVIFMSQRGTYTATPRLTCPGFDRGAEKTLAMPYNAPETGHVYLELARECRADLLHLHIDLSAYNTLESANDLDELRQALGIEEWNVYGISYGTDLALNYMRMHPKGIRSVGIDGIFPPQLAGGISAWTSAGEGIDAIFEACAKDQRCHGRYPAIATTFGALVNKYEREPELVHVSLPSVSDKVPVMISGGMLLQWTISPGTHWAAKVPAYIDDLAHGKPDPIARTWAMSRRDPDAIGVLGDGLFFGVSCGEWVPYETETGVIAAGRRAFRTFYPPIWENAPNLPFMRQNCRAWDVPPVSDKVRAVTKSEIPTLVVNAQYDGQTAASFGPLVARTLPNSTVVTIPNVAHVAFASPSKEANECTHKIVHSFLEKLSGPNTDCIKDVKPTEFEITKRPGGARQ